MLSRIVLDILYPYPPSNFCNENVVCFIKFAVYIQVHFRLDLIMEANNVSPDQTAPKEQSVMGPYCLQ